MIITHSTETINRSSTAEYHNEHERRVIMSRDMSVVNAVNARTQERIAVALESVASSLKGICQDAWEIKELLQERERREQKTGE